MIYLDTQIVVWLFNKEFGRFLKKTTLQSEQNELFISPTVLLELQRLNELEIKPATQIAFFSKAWKRCFQIFQNLNGFNFIYFLRPGREESPPHCGVCS